MITRYSIKQLELTTQKLCLDKDVAKLKKENKALRELVVDFLVDEKGEVK